MAETGWAYHTDGSRPVHVWPHADWIRHETDDDDGDCPCGPQVEPVPREGGSTGWLVKHHPLNPEL